MAIFKRMLPVYLLALAAAVGLSVALSRVAGRLSAVTAGAEAGGAPVIVVDPGHGGEDGGALAPSGTKEAARNLEISLRLRDLLRFLGCSVRMTRETDVSVHSPEALTVSEKKVSDLKNRVRAVNETPGAVLISIHQNTFPEARYRGAQVFYTGSARSKALAEALQRVLGERLDPDNHRQAKQTDSVYLLNQVSCPAALVECGFLSNPREEQLLGTADYQKKLAAAIAAGLTQAISDAARS
ncbi:MAG: N-acetylmuramoyl-L-alanine amidase [Oscillospiraceae bacterium]|nr:N-acetylmuramoyl-L-alanine amidase [Oscillospiraceae bacterium]MBR7010277.1 N-acetylmuramoyl-L-alanine amidase [Oscillospiraceae bacterium]